MAEASAIENVRRDISERSDSDRILSTGWILLPIIAVGIAFLIGIAVAVAVFAVFSQLSLDPDVGFVPPEDITSLPLGTLGPVVAVIFSFALLGEIISSLLYAYLFYMLIRRRNRHFARQSRFSGDLISYLRSLSSRKGFNAEVGISSMERTVREMGVDETEKTAILWAILLFIPIVNLFSILYMLYFLGKDFRLHERREDLFLEDSRRVLESLGISVTLGRIERIPDRSFVLYLIMSIVTLGLFGIYWLYTLIADPNSHFRFHIRFEDELMGRITALR